MKAGNSNVKTTTHYGTSKKTKTKQTKTNKQDFVWETHGKKSIKMQKEKQTNKKQHLTNSQDKGKESRQSSISLQS